MIDVMELHGRLREVKLSLIDLERKGQPSDPITQALKSMALDDIRAIELMLACVERVDLAQYTEGQETSICDT